MEDNNVEEDSDMDLPIKQDQDPTLVDMTAIKMDTDDERDREAHLNKQHIGNFQWLNNFFRTVL